MVSLLLKKAQSDDLGIQKYVWYAWPNKVLRSESNP